MKLLKKEKILGLSISSDDISGAILNFSKKEKKIFIEKFNLLKFKDPVLVKNQIKNKKTFLQTIDEFLLGLFGKKIPKFIPTIISIPSYDIYTQIFDFPDSISYDKLQSSMKLQVGFSLPLDISQTYLDWELVDPDEKKVFLAQVKKEIIDNHLSIFSRTPIDPIALEIHPMSFNRVIALFEDKSFMSVFIDSQGFEIGISKNGTLRLVKSNVWEDFPGFFQNQSINNDFKRKTLFETIFRTINFFQTDEIDSGEVEKIYLISSSFDLKELKDYLSKNISQKIIIPDFCFDFKKPKKNLKKLEKIKKEIDRLKKSKKQLIDKLLLSLKTIEERENEYTKKLQNLPVKNSKIEELENKLKNKEKGFSDLKFEKQYEK